MITAVSLLGLPGRLLDVLAYVPPPARPCEAQARDVRFGSGADHRLTVESGYRRAGRKRGRSFQQEMIVKIYNHR